MTVDRTVRARVATAVFFGAYGTILGAWTARIPDVKQGLELSDGQLSIALLGFAAGAMVGMQAAGRFVDRIGGARLMAPAALLDGVLLITPAFAPTLAMLVAALCAFGAAHGTLNIAMNANAVRVERAWGRPIMSSFHAVYSIGGFLGAAGGGLFAHAGGSAAATFVTVAAVVLSTVLIASRWAATSDDGIAGGATAGPAAAHVTGRTGPAVAFLGVLAFCCLVGEGATADWAAVYLRDTLGSAAGVAAAGYAAFAVMMTVGRLAGDRLAAAIGPELLVRGCAALAAGGLGTALLVGQPVAGVIGFGCFGAGLSCIAPLIFSAAGNRDPALAGRAIAKVATLGWLGFLVGPVVIGVLAELVGLAAALAVPVALAGFVAFAATALRTSPRPQAT